MTGTPASMGTTIDLNDDPAHRAGPETGERQGLCHAFGFFCEGDPGAGGAMMMIRV